MVTQSQAIKRLFKICASLSMWVIFTGQALAQQKIWFQVDGQVVHVLRPNSAVEAEAVGGDVRILVCGWELGTEECDQHLNSLLNRFAKRYLEKEIKKSQFTPSQIAKLEIAARLQVARDCRAIQQIGLDYRQQNGDKMNLLDTCEAIEQLIDIGVDREDSLFRKVKNSLR